VDTVASLWLPYQAAYLLSISTVYICYCHFRKDYFCVITGFRREVDENCGLLDCNAKSSGNCLPTFRNSLSSHLQGVNNPINKITLTVNGSLFKCFMFTNRCNYLLVLESTKIYIKIYIKMLLHVSVYHQGACI
jgi:hypothetical protein